MRTALETVQHMLPGVQTDETGAALGAEWEWRAASEGMCASLFYPTDHPVHTLVEKHIAEQPPLREFLQASGLRWHPVVAVALVMFIAHREGWTR